MCATKKHSIPPKTNHTPIDILLEDKKPTSLEVAVKNKLHDNDYKRY